MTPQEKGKLGGTSTRENHISVCPLCGAPVKSQHFMTIGQRGGERAAQTAGKNGILSMSERGRLGGRGRTREKRNRTHAENNVSGTLEGQERALVGVGSVITTPDPKQPQVLRAL